MCLFSVEVHFAVRHLRVFNNSSLLSSEATEKCDGKVNTRGTKYHLYFIKGLCLWAVLNPRNSNLSCGSGLGQASPWSL